MMKGAIVGAALMVFWPVMASAQVRVECPNGRMVYSSSEAMAKAQCERYAAPPGEPRQQQPAHPVQQGVATPPARVEPIPVSVEVTNNEVADAVRRVKQSLVVTQKAEADCLGIHFNGPTEKDVARASQAAAQATLQAHQADRIADQASQWADAKRSSADSAINDIRNSRTIPELIINGVDAKQQIRESKGASAVADDAQIAAGEAYAVADQAKRRATDTAHDLDLKKSGGARECAALLGEKRQSLEQLLQLASTNPNAFKAKVAQAKAEYLARAKRQHEEFQAKVKPDLDALLQIGLTISGKVDFHVPYAEIVADVDTLRLQLTVFKYRYGPALSNESADGLVAQVLRASDAILAAFDSWKRELRASADVATLQRQFDSFSRGSSIIAQSNAAQAARGLQEAKAMETEAHTQREGQWRTTKQLLDEARKTARGSGQEEQMVEAERRAPAQR